MRVWARISLIRISRGVLSITFSAAQDVDVEQLGRLKGGTLRFVLVAGNRKAWFDGRMVSCGVRKRASFVVHTAVRRAVVVRLLEMRNADLAVDMRRERNPFQGKVVPFRGENQEGGRRESAGRKFYGRAGMEKLASIPGGSESDSEPGKTPPQF